MPIHNFNDKHEANSSIDRLPDMRSDVEKLNTPLAIFNHDKPDLALYERWAEEIINISGAVVTVFLKEPKSKGAGDQKDIWDEDADPVYRLGIKLKAFIKLNQWQLELTKFGVDSPLDLKVVFSRAILGKAIGFDRMLNPGDVIEIPYNRTKAEGQLRFRVKNESDSGNVNYRWMYYTAECQLITGDASIKVPFETRKIN